ncbi:MAG: HAMP domain-containing histidine kinase [Gammaproteobacteria bacterium]|nr:HAMP domain-containing histidine kinase [Gammaproteobacteria bacterium]
MKQIPIYKLHSRVTVIFLVIAIVSTISYLTSMVVIVNKLETTMLATLVGHEVSELAVELSIDPKAQMPDTASVKAYLLSREHLRPIPDYLRGLKPDVYNKILVGESTYQVAIIDLNDDRMFVSFDTTGMSRYRSIILTMLIVGGIISTFVLAVSGFWLFRKFLLPVSNLAHEVSNIDPEDRKIRIEDKYRNNEVGVIAQSIDLFMARLDEFVEREQSFTAVVSHELRTPVSVIITATDLLEVKGVTEEQQVVIKRIRESTTYMHDVIEALLFFARDTRKLVEKTMPQISLHTTFLKIMENYEKLASEKKLVLLFKRKAMLDVRMSESHIEIILGNLIRNAIVNTDEGEVKVTLFKNGFSVRDTGRGIESDEIELIVQRSHQSMDSSGFGLGLYLVENLCDIYGLKLEVVSTVGYGSDFVVYFPEEMLEQISEREICVPGC